MKPLALLLAASAVVLADLDPATCPDYLFFNRTNAAHHKECAQHTYQCTTIGDPVFFNSTDEATRPELCSKRAVYSLYFEDPGLMGPVVLPDIVATGTLQFSSRQPLRANITQAELDEYLTVPNPGDLDVTKLKDGDKYVTIFLDMTRISFPDLINVTGYGLKIEDVNTLSILEFPKLENIDGNLDLDIADGPPINITFPKLSHVYSGIYVVGNIDTLTFPSLNSTTRINVTSTGDLDCLAFAKSVVYATEWPVRFGDREGHNDSVICNSKKASVTMYPVPPEATPTNTESSGSRVGLGFGSNLILLAILVAGISSAV
ncbi:hypothetical protein V490_03390 [Pseudogymnoascus sp. VKM F-3557]|nr:hypothetical protein V490_03390 [Pseudogymnoascus sp. VKM F-3557]